MQPGEILCRAAIHPKYKVEEVFDEVSFLNFTRKKKKYPYMTSVTSLEVAGSEENVHAAGRRTAVLANKRPQTDQTDGSDNQRQVFYYLGYYSLFSADVHLLSSEYHRAEVHWRPEDGLDSHFHIEIYRSGDNELKVDKDDLKSDKNAIVSTIADLMFGPTYCPIAANEPELRVLQVTTLKKRERKFYLVTPEDSSLTKNAM